jgi:hypothetical protein
MHSFAWLPGKIECEIHACMLPRTHCQVHMMLLSLLATAACATFEPDNHCEPPDIWSELDAVELDAVGAALWRSTLAAFSNLQRTTALLGERMSA